MQKTEKWVLDCDISVDYKNKNIRFSHKEKLFSWKTLFMFAEYSLCFTTIMFIILLAVGVDFPYIELYPLTFFGMFFGFILFFFLGALPFALEIEFFRNLYFKLRTRTLLKKVIIQNPEGIIKYATRELDPLIDLEYDENVRKNLLTVELKKIPKKGRFDSRGKTGKNELIITLSGKTKGELVIKEY